MHYQIQLRRSAASVSANIAEGHGQESAAQFARFLSIAIASALESESHIIELGMLCLLPADTVAHLLGEFRIVRAMCIRLRTALRRR